MESTDLVIARHADVTAVLSDPRFVVPPAGERARPRSPAWLRQTVRRFSEGADHERRRALVVDSLDAMHPADLRKRARTRVLDGDAPEQAPVGVLGDPDRFDPDRRERPHLTFGAGRRPCPAAVHAPHLAAGVVEAVLSGTEVHR